MTTPIESARPWWRRAPAVGLVSVAAVLALLLGILTDVQWATGLASLAGFAAAITVIAAVATCWEHVVVDARTERLVETED